MQSCLLSGKASAENRKRKRTVTVGEILELADEVWKLPVLSTNSEDEILGYDERGIPRS